MFDIVNLAAAAGLPDIALAPGVAAIAPLLTDDPSALAALGSAQWGIFSSANGSPVVIADTCLDLGYIKGFQVSDFVIESGGFISYDSVEQQFEARVRVASGGSADVRAALIESVEGILGDLNLYDVVTPDKIYVQANLVREEYRRTVQDAGGSLLQMDLTLQEVRELQSQSGQATQDPASADQQNGGVVQPAGTVGLPYEVTAGIDPAASSSATGVADVPLPPERPASLQPSYSQGSLGPGGQLGHA